MNTMFEPPTDDKKEDLKKLVELNDDLENFFRNTIIPQLFIDADLILRKYSPPGNKHFKLVPSDIGKPIYKIPTLSNIKDFVECIIDVINHNNDLEKEVQTEDKRWFQMNVLPYIIKNQNITNGVVITFIDITDRINDKREIEKINADHETFIYSVSHDFRGPLTNMVLLVDMLKSAIDKNEKEEIRVFTEKIEESTHALTTLINELTDITKLGNDPNDKPAPVNIEQIIEEVKFTLKNQIYQSHAEISTNFLVSEVQFSCKNLRSIMYNLISNAIKFATPDVTPVIIIKTEEAGEYTLLSVKDNGAGIEENKQDEIFLKFTRLKPQIEGTGVGLFIVSKMVTNQGGKIEVVSNTDSGTTFNIYIKN